MYRYVIRRILLMIPLLILVTLAVAMLLRMVPGDPATIILGETATEADREAFRDAYHLNESLPKQYLRWWNDVVHGNFGTSVSQRTNVRDELVQRLPITIELLVLSIVFTAVIGIPLGVVAAVRQNSWWDYASRSIAILGLSVPSFWLGTLVITLPAIWWGYLPPLGRTAIWDTPLSNLQQYSVPALTISVGAAAIVMRLARSALLDVLRQDYIRTARAKGLTSQTVMLRHALKNSLIPVVTVLGLQVAYLLSGSVIIESIFNLQGVGSLLITSITFRDYPTVQGLVLFFAVSIMVANLVVDLSYAWLDPRIRFS